MAWICGPRGLRSRHFYILRNVNDGVVVTGRGSKSAVVWAFAHIYLKRRFMRKRYGLCSVWSGIAG